MSNNPYSDLMQQIDASSCCCELKGLLKAFIEREFAKPSIQCCSNDNKSDYRHSLKYLIILTHDLNINDISWSHFCLTLEKIYFDLESKKYGPWAHRAFREFYKYVIVHTDIQTESIDILKTYQEYLDIPERRRTQHNALIHPRIYSDVYLNFGVHTVPSRLYHYMLPSQGKNDDSYDMLINLNTDNSFIQKLLIDFIESYPKGSNEYGVFRMPTTLIFGQFIYYFNNSLYAVNDGTWQMENDLPLYPKIYKSYTKISDFDFKTFTKQFRFYNMIDEKFPVTSFQKNDWGEYRCTLLQLLKSFYIFLINYIQEKEINHNPFMGSDINKTVLMGSYFNTYFKQGYFFVNDVRMSNIPKRNRVAVIITEHSDKARGSNDNIRSFDFSLIKNLALKDDLIDYIFNSKNKLDTRRTDYNYLVDFLNFKYVFDTEQYNISCFNKDTLFTEDFMFSYRLHVMDRYEVNRTMDMAVGAVKKFIKYHKRKYKPGEFLFKYLRLFDRGNSGGKPIPLKDFNVIMEAFRSLKDDSVRNELCFIVLYLCSTCKVRPGEILKLRRDCIVRVNEEESTGTIQYYAKGSDRNQITEVIPIYCIHMLERAKSITKAVAAKSDKSKRNYIFIIEAYKYKSTGTAINTVFLAAYYKRLFLKVQKDAGLNNKYSPYQVRHTRKNMIYEEGSKAGFSDFEINEMLGGTIQVNLKNYIKRHNNELYVEIFSGVTISNVDINGKIMLEDVEGDLSYVVGNGIGSCDRFSCEKNQFFDSLRKDDYKCLICTHFRTCCSRMDSFRNEIIQTKNEFENCADDKYKQFLESKLKLLGAYLKRLIDLDSGEVDYH